MKVELQKLLKKDKLVKNILIFFFQNQASVDSADGVSAWVQDDIKKVQSALKKMVKLGVLEEDSMGAAKGYCYTRNGNTMKIVENLMRNV